MLKILVFLLLIFPIRADSFQGKVIAVLDGDTIKVLDNSKSQIKIRFNGIDAPEKTQAFGTQSKKKLSDKIFGKTVEVRINTIDKYGRTVADIYLGERWINLEMVSEGFAWHYKKYSEDVTLAEAEENARKNKDGLWKDNKPIPPWEFRHPGSVKNKNESESIEVRNSKSKYTLNPKSGIRHNQNCQYFNSKNNRPCSNHAGKACKVCGG